MKLTESDMRRHMQRRIDFALETDDVAKPHVGAVIVSCDGSLISEGRRRLDSDGHMLIHAERDAVNNAQGTLRDATLFTTLEPCLVRFKTHGSFPLLSTCAELIHREGIGMVVYGLPDKHNDGTCIPYLRNNGITVVNFSEFNDLILGGLMSLKTRESYIAPGS
jgi:diaminohydroxyphosphoribosylaminopyrimidine deaminase / 5-amino-6-(5-phosphoribosylamino)uracil reductase